MNVWRDRFQRWFAPMARRVPLSPNVITLIALAINAGGAVLLYRRQFLLAIVLIAAGGVADLLDGLVARVQGKTSRFGDFLDHFCDRVSDVMLMTAWLLGNAVRVEIAMAAIIVIMLNGYLGTQLEATWHEREYDTLGRGEFVLGLIVFPIVSFILYDNGWDAIAYAGLRIPDWMSVALIAFSLLGIAQRLRLAGKLGRAR